MHNGQPRIMLPEEIARQQNEAIQQMQILHGIRLDLTKTIAAQIVGRDLTHDVFKKLAKGESVQLHAGHVAQVSVMYADAVMESLGMPNIGKVNQQAQ